MLIIFYAGTALSHFPGMFDLSNFEQSWPGKVVFLFLEEANRPLAISRTKLDGPRSWETRDVPNSRLRSRPNCYDGIWCPACGGFGICIVIALGVVGHVT
jgi:hypothetical protein